MQCPLRRNCACNVGYTNPMFNTPVSMYFIKNHLQYLASNKLVRAFCPPTKLYLTNVFIVHCTVRRSVMGGGEPLPMLRHLPSSYSILPRNRIIVIRYSHPNDTVFLPSSTPFAYNSSNRLRTSLLDLGTTEQKSRTISFISFISF
jgi:hypothetical protein